MNKTYISNTVCSISTSLLPNFHTTFLFLFHQMRGKKNSLSSNGNLQKPTSAAASNNLSTNNGQKTESVTTVAELEINGIASVKGNNQEEVIIRMETGEEFNQIYL
jgi:hypothetical protein